MHIQTPVVSKLRPDRSLTFSSQFQTGLSCLPTLPFSLFPSFLSLLSPTTCWPAYTRGFLHASSAQRRRVHGHLSLSLHHWLKVFGGWLVPQYTLVLVLQVGHWSHFGVIKWVIFGHCGSFGSSSGSFWVILGVWYSPIQALSIGTKKVCPRFFVGPVGFSTLPTYFATLSPNLKSVCLSDVPVPSYPWLKVSPKLVNWYSIESSRWGGLRYTSGLK